MLREHQPLLLWVFPDGATRRRLAYTFSGKQKTYATGVYLAVMLAQARATRGEGKAAAKASFTAIPSRPRRMRAAAVHCLARQSAGH
jgi:hypothetical protein